MFIFVSDQGILNLLNSDVIGGYGTFLCAAKLFKQHWIAQAGFENGGVYVPSLFVLMTHRTEHAYVRLFSTIKKVCGAQELKPKHFMVDPVSFTDEQGKVHDYKAKIDALSSILAL